MGKASDADNEAADEYRASPPEEMVERFGKPAGCLQFPDTVL